MDNLKIKGTRYSPEIVFDAGANLLDIKGESYHENVMEFFDPVFSWLDNYIAQLEYQQVTVNVELVYFNTSSSKVLINLFDILDDAASSGKNIAINWIYDEEDDNALEFGEEFKEDLEFVVFNLVTKKNSSEPDSSSQTK